MEEKMRIIVSGMEPKAPCKHDVKKMNQIQRALENYLDDEYGYRKVFFIVAPTGAGKTTLMEQTVFTRASKNVRILYVSSRIAINVQLKRRILGATYLDDEAGRYTDKGIMETETFGNITIVTFAGLYRKMISGKFARDSFDIVCFDEPQALYADAIFCSYTGYVLEHLTCFFADCKKIFLTYIYNFSFL